MPKLHELRETRAARVSEMTGLLSTAEAAKRELDGNESARFEALKLEVRGIDTSISRAETLADLERHADAIPAAGGNAGSEELERRYSIGKALEEFTRSGRLTGAEAEYAQERRSGRQGAFCAPVSAFLGGERRAVLTTAPVAGPGGALVATQLGPLIDRPRPTLATEKLGATILTGLTGNLDLPRLKSSGSANWVAEHQPVTGSDPQFDKVEMGPKTVTARYEVSRRMMLQAPAIEQILRNDLGQLLAAALDQAALMGTGADNTPRGIRGSVGVHKVDGTYSDAASPTVPEVDDLVATLMGLIDAGDIVGATGFVGHPLVKATLSRLRGADGASIGLDILQGEPAVWSTQVPANGGVTTDRAHLFYGAWNALILGYWSAVDILVNPYASEMADRGGARIHAFLDCDVAVRHPGAFAYTDNLPVGGLLASTRVA